MPDSDLLMDMMESAIGGVSKTQIRAHLMRVANLTEKEATAALAKINFAKKPNYINYWKFYNTKLDPNANRIYFPFTKIYEYKNFLEPTVCQELIDIADQKTRRSCVANPKDEAIVTDYRTSWTADLNWAEHKICNELDGKIARTLGLDLFLGELLQLQKYLPGEYYKEHCDYFHWHTKEHDVYTEWMGQRTWTFMIYLNDVEEGGETYFKRLNLKVKPKQGKAVFWSNLYPFGMPNPKTLHEALPPISGNKYVITKWWRSWSLIP